MRAAALVDNLLARLARVTSSGVFVPEVDGLRFFAITSVLLYHVSRRMPHDLGVIGGGDFSSTVSSALTYLFDRGFFGVRLFFVISGFILALPFASHYLEGQRRPSLRRYYWRRITRLEPPYMIALGACFGLIALEGIGEAMGLLKNLAASAVYMHWLALGSIPRINGVLWSLECEVQFYILAPVIAMLFRIHHPALRRAIFVIGPLLIWGSFQALRELRISFGDVSHWHPIRIAGVLSTLQGKLLIVSFLGYFCAGFVLADVFLTSWKSKPAKTWTWDLVGVAACAFLAITVAKSGSEARANWMDFVLYPPLIMAIFMAAFRGCLWNRVTRNRWLVTIGGMCYTIYLYHQVIIIKVLPYSLPMSHSLMFQGGLMFVLCVSVSSLLFVLFEKPFMYRDWPSRWRAKIVQLSGSRPAREISEG